jgi:uncharacterized protein YbcI
MPTQDPIAAADRGAMRSQLANAVVRLHAENYGRGPTRARAHLGEDFVLILLEDVFTTAERTLVRAGRGDEVRRIRSAFGDAMADQFKAAVERITGRKVRAFLSQTCLDPEVATELFLLEPAEEPPAP